MRVLRLGNSEDLSDRVPEEQRAWRVAAAVLEGAVGEPVETVLRPIAPTLDLPERVGGWLDEFQPDLVLLKVSWYWYAYESVPRRVERIFGRAGRPVARASVSATRNESIARNRGFKFGRRLAHRVIGGDTPYASGQVLEVMQATIRRVAARESVAMVVKGTGGTRAKGEGFDGPFERFTKRRLEVEGGIEQFCASLGVPYSGTLPRSQLSADELKETDGIHRLAVGHGRMGQQEGDLMVASWRAFTSDGAAASR